MTKAELIKALATKTGMSVAQTDNVLARLADITAEELAVSGDAVLPGIGKLSVTLRSARIGRNPKTGEAIEIPARGAVKFKPATVLKTAVV